MAAKPRIVFHIGLEKTGTDSFQRFCSEQRALLKEFSTLYPTESLAFGAYNHEPLVAAYLDDGDVTIRSSRRPRREVLESLMAEIARSGAGTVLISGEHFSSRFREGQIERLAADFSGFDCRIAVVVRAHRARLFSAYSQSVLAGRGLTLDEYCDEVFAPDNRYMRCAVTIGAWDRVFGRDKVSVFRHTRGIDIVPVLGEALISPELPVSRAPPYWENISIGPGATEWLRRVNAAVNRIPGLSRPAARLALREPRRALARLFARLNPNRDPAGWRLSDANLRRLNKIVAADAAWLADRYGVRLEDRGADRHSEAMKLSTCAK